MSIDYRELHAGDLVKLSPWNELMTKYGGSSYGIRTAITLEENMEKRCGEIFKIKKVIKCSENMGKLILFDKDGTMVERYISTDCIDLYYEVPLTAAQLLRTVKCANCGAVTKKHRANKTMNNSYICNECAAVKDYCDTNDIAIHKPSKSNKTYGFELECVPIDELHKNSIISSKYNLLPTEDGSISSIGGVEFKTPIYQSTRGLRKLFKTFDSHVDFSSEYCGQHINIGDSKYINNNNIQSIRVYAPEIFTPLYHYMRSNVDKTKKVCGRYFTGYADLKAYSDHSSWINFNHDNRLEFRLSKFVTPNQYFELAMMWTEMLDVVISDFLKFNTAFDAKVSYAYTYGSSEVIKNSKLMADGISVSEKLIEIFKKYADGKAICQKRVA